MNKSFEFIKNFIIFAYILVIIFVTICLLSYNDYKVTVLGNNTLLPIIDDYLEPDYKVGDLLIIKKGRVSDVNVGDKVFFYKTRSGVTEVNISEVRDLEKLSDRETTLTVDGDLRFSSTNYIGKVETAKTISKLGFVLGMLESKWGFLFLGVFPSLIVFLWTLYSVVLEFYDSNGKKKKKSKKEKKDDESKEETKVEETKEEVVEKEEDKTAGDTKETKEEKEKSVEESKENTAVEVEETKSNEKSNEEDDTDKNVEEEKIEAKEEAEEAKEEVKEETKEEPEKVEPKEEKKELSAEEKKRLIEEKMKALTPEQKKALIEAKLKSMTPEEKKALIEAKKKKLEEQKKNEE